MFPFQFGQNNNYSLIDERKNEIRDRKVLPTTSHTKKLTKMFRMEFSAQCGHTPTRDWHSAMGTDGALTAVKTHFAQEMAQMVEERSG
jgi:predicted GNAT family acetyltransferase